MFAPSALLALATTRPCPPPPLCRTAASTLGGAKHTPSLRRTALPSSTARGKTSRRRSTTSATIRARSRSASASTPSGGNRHPTAPSTRPRRAPRSLLHGQREPGRQYVNNTGLMWELGEQLGALLVFAEHRYEPLSHPALRARLAALLCLLHHRAGDRRLGDHHRLAPQTARRPRARRRLRRLVRRDARGLVPYEVPRRRGRRDRSVGSDLAARGHRAARDARHAGSRDHARRERGGRRHRPVPRQPARGVAVDPAGGAHTPRPSAALCSRRRLPRDRQRRRPQPVGAAALLLHGGGAHYLALHYILTASAHSSPLTTLGTHQGNYPFESTYITYSVVPGKAYPLPAWPMRVACAGGYGGGGGLNADFGVKLTGSVADVKYSLALGDISVDVDWKTGTGNGDKLTEAQINVGVPSSRGGGGRRRRLANSRKTSSATTSATATTPPRPRAPLRARRPPGPAVVAPPAAAARRLEAAAAANDGVEAPATKAKSCPACPPCDDCPPCPVSFCDYETTRRAFTGELSRGFSWGGSAATMPSARLTSRAWAATSSGRRRCRRNSAQFCAFLDARPAGLSGAGAQLHGRVDRRAEADHAAAARTRRAASCAAARSSPTGGARGWRPTMGAATTSVRHIPRFSTKAASVADPMSPPHIATGRHTTSWSNGRRPVERAGRLPVPGGGPGGRWCRTPPPTARRFRSCWTSAPTTSIPRSRTRRTRRASRRRARRGERSTAWIQEAYDAA